MRVKVWVAGLPTSLFAVMSITVDETPVAVPARKAVPLPWSVKVTPFGRAPASDRPAVGLPVVVTVKLPGIPTVKVAVLGEVIAGGVCTTRENEVECTALCRSQSP